MCLTGALASRYITEMPQEDAEHSRGHRFPYMACEVFTSEVNAINEMFFTAPPPPKRLVLKKALNKNYSPEKKIESPTRFAVRDDEDEMVLMQGEEDEQEGDLGATLKYRVNDEESNEEKATSPMKPEAEEEEEESKEDEEKPDSAEEQARDHQKEESPDKGTETPDEE